MENCLFCKIASKEIDTIVLHEDEDIMAFHDIEPQAPVHILIIPKAHIASAQELGEKDAKMLGKIFALAADLADKNNLQKGWRLVTNVGQDGGQSVQHLHFHLLGGRSMTWPPG